MSDFPGPDDRAIDVAGWLERFASLLAAGRAEDVAGMFIDGGWWRDFLAFTGTIRTIEGGEDIVAMVKARAARTGAHGWSTDAAAGASEGFIHFETSLGEGRGYLRLEEGKAQTLLTTLHELRGHEMASGFRRPLGSESMGHGQTWKQALAAERAEIDHERDPYVLIVGAGQGGLALGATLRQLGVPCLLIDKWPRVGDQWRSRYNSLTLHDPVWYDHMPYLPFPESWPVYTPKDKMGDWLEFYASVFDLNVWGETECRHAAYDEAAGRWTVQIVRGGEVSELHPAQLVMAVGNAGFPNVPEFPGQECFAGEVYHSSAHPDGEGLAGQRVVVIGSNNSAHDIAMDLVLNGADATMIQRSSTHIVRQTTMTDVLMKPSYSQEAVESGLSTERADLRSAAYPIRLQEALNRVAWKVLHQSEAAFYDRLEAAGFLLDFGPDGTGIAMKYLRSASGYYIDVGASEMVADGRIRLLSGRGIARFVSDGIVLDDGTHVPADRVVLATGFGSMEQWVAQIMGPAMADRIGRCWGYGSGFGNDPGPWEGELRNMWKPTAQPGLWFMGGNLAQTRLFARYLGLQLKARQEGLEL
ncbi:NAD(P)/FAD-dependent oxidoreductase [Novosphingobium sp. KCTC 2891]|uniref:flavin-containing monooxygenase n=1 Tax=Novosphingobium sp. KCTC 2891 TaxID=2989730 RepID=UPI0022223D2E|nr:NAD(P)/FAD-dependent oxidoreductase [Novosphingobium sp. KCTC 2891]MCW1383712.1 NAD(P)/FAD-dependent oxidoreductase [Novosphingobium sp. KCTC 2891]